MFVILSLVKRTRFKYCTKIFPRMTTRSPTSQEFDQATALECHSDQQSFENKRPQFGNRYLTDTENVFQHNAWDNVEWDDSLEKEAKSKVLENSTVLLDKDLQEKYEREAHCFWDAFYDIHQNRFFKDRHWLFTEFPELAPNLQSAPLRIYPSEGIEEKLKEPHINEEIKTLLPFSDDSHQNEYPGSRASFRFLEIGCGVGNTIFPILETNNDPDTFIYGCDFSKTAIEIVTQHPLYDTKRCYAFLCDISDEVWETPFPENTLDIIILIFVLSAIEPKKMQNVANFAAKYLKPGGLVLFRDYGRYDMAQLRFKPGRCLSDNFYARGDGTLVYFFDREEIKDLFCKAGLYEEQVLIDRRLQVNRGKQLKMYRVWIQCKFRKPLS